MSSGNATRWYTTREAVKAAVGISGPDLNALIDGYIEAGSEDVEEILNRRFIPETAIKYFRWPQRIGNALVLTFPDEDLIAVTLLQAAAQDDTPTTIVAADYFVEPVNQGPPFTSIEIDLSSSAAFASGETPQRSIAVTGRWGLREDTIAAGAVVGAVNDSQVTLAVTDSALIGVGNTVLIAPGAAAAAGSVAEAMFVSAKALLDTGTNTNGALNPNKAETTVTVVDGTAVKQGEVITINSERMLVEDIAGDNLIVARAYDASVLAAHDDVQDIYAPRTLTLTRGENGTTATVHDTATVINKYTPPGDIAEYVTAYAIAHREQGRSGWTGVVGGDMGSVETKMFGLWALREALKVKYGKVSL
jgi:hypothetical protein